MNRDDNGDKLSPVSLNQNSDNDNNNNQIQARTAFYEADFKAKAQVLNECVLGTNYFTIGGVVLGSLLAIRSGPRRNFRPFVALSFAGLVADLYFGYNMNCMQQKQEFERAKDTFRKISTTNSTDKQNNSSGGSHSSDSSTDKTKD